MKKNIFILVSIFAFVLFSGISCSSSSKTLGVYKSDDSGNSWQEKVNISDKKTIKNVEVKFIKIDFSDSNIIYIGTREKGVYKTNNGGESWQQTSLNSGNIYAIDINPKDTAIIYASGYFGTLGKIYKSNNGGESFEEVYSETHGKTPVMSLAVDSYDPRRIYAGTESGALLKSEDSGRSWILQKELKDSVVEIAINPHDTRHILAGTDSKGIFKTENGGQDWRDLSESLEDFDKSRNIHSIVFDLKNEKKVYLGSLFGLMVSNDEGETWKEVSVLTKPKRNSVINIALDASDESNIYLTLDSTVYKKSNKEGQGWEVKKITTEMIKSIACDPNNYQVIYVGIGKEGDDYK